MTLILKRAPHVLDAVTGGQDTVGLRIPSHPVAHALLAAFGDAVDIVLDGGASAVGIESTIVDCSGAALRILRPGAVTATMIAEVLGREEGVALHRKEKAPRVSGSLDAHYAPRTRLLLIAPEALAAAIAQHASQPLAVLSRARPAAFNGEWRPAAADPAGYARDIYARLRELDGVNAALMLIEAPPQGAEWDGINDRLRRAAFGSGEA